MAVSDGRQIVVFKDLGLVSQVFDEQTLTSLRGHIAVVRNVGWAFSQVDDPVVE